MLQQLMSSTSGKELSGAKAFELYDTFGFPIDLTALILSEHGMTLNAEDFQKEMEKQKARSRAASQVDTEDWVELLDDEEQEFVGYDLLSTPVWIVRYRKITNKYGDLYQLVFNITPFYPEGGGQVGDKGYLEASNGEVVYIVDTKKENNLIVHKPMSLWSWGSEKLTEKGVMWLDVEYGKETTIGKKRIERTSNLFV